MMKLNIHNADVPIRANSSLKTERSDMNLLSSAIQAMRFGAVGLGATVVHYGVALLMNEFYGIAPLWSNLIAFLSAWPVSYLGNYFWTFSTSASHRQSFFRFAFAAICGLLLSQLIVWIGAENMGYSLRIALIPALILVPMFSFTMSLFWVFPAREADTCENNS